MLRRSKDAYTDRSITPRFRRILTNPRVRVLLGDWIPAGDQEPGSEDDQPCGDHFISKDMECHQGGGSGAAGGLTETDILLIHDQARLQHAETPEQIQGLTDAWNAAKYAIGKTPEVFADPEKTEEFALLLGALIEPKKGRYRYVGIESTKFIPGPGRPGVLDPENIPQAMKGLWMAFSEQLLEPDEWYREFQQIHPLEDGNGRLGDIMWKVAKVRKGEEWPTSHPPDLFGTDPSDYSAPILKE